MSTMEVFDPQRFWKTEMTGSSVADFFSAEGKKQVFDLFSFEVLRKRNIFFADMRGQKKTKEREEKTF